MGLFNTGIIIGHFNVLTQQIDKYQFGSFENRELAFKRITALWKDRAPEDVWSNNKKVVVPAGDASEPEPLLGGKLLAVETARKMTTTMSNRGIKTTPDFEDNSSTSIALAARSENSFVSVSNQPQKLNTSPSTKDKEEVKDEKIEH